MKILIYGAGAIGCLLAAKISFLDHKIYLKTRGIHSENIKKNGLKFQNKNKNEKVNNNNIEIIEDIYDIKELDFLFITLKANSLLEASEDLSYLSSLNTTIISFVNGIPYWYFYELKGEYKNYKIRSIDSNENLYKILPPEKIIGTVVYPSCEIPSPGVIKLIEGNRFSIGEINGGKTERILKLNKILSNAGFKAPIKSNIRNEIWYKLWGNLAFNPISAITGFTLKQIYEDKYLMEIIIKMMKEAEIIANKLNIKFIFSIEKRIQSISDIDHKTSMLQDFEKKKPIELEAILGSVKELGSLTETSCPSIETIYNLLKSDGLK